MAGRSRVTSRQVAGLAELGSAFARLRRRCTRQGRGVRQLAAQAEDIAMLRGIAFVGRGRRQNAALGAIREEVGYHAAWARWSTTYDELSILGDQIDRHPASSLADLVIKFDVLVWLLLDDGAVVDRQAARQVRVFRRALAGLASVAR